MSNPVDDVLAARGGDRSAFERLVRAHMHAVCAITTAVMSSTAAAEEVAQETFVQAWQRLHTLRDPARFGSWVRGIARNRARDARRSRRRRPEDGPDPAVLPAPHPDPDQRLDDARLWHVLDDLDEDHREVLVLYYRQDCSVREVARQLELTEPTVRKRLSRARKRLREHVEEHALHAELQRHAPRAAPFAGAVLAGLGLAASRTARAGWRTAALAAAGAGSLLLAVGTARVHAGLQAELAALEPAALGAPPPTSATEVTGTTPAAPIPDHVTHAFLAAEDARFFEHGAVDPWAIGRAAWHNLTSDGGLQGGSTLTQQLAKRRLVRALPEPSLRRKGLEVLLAFELERRMDKEAILSDYLDEVYLGSGATGLARAAQVYFRKPVHELTLAEGALLAGIPSNPRGHDPFDAPAAAAARRHEVLQHMVDQGWATPAQMHDALRTPLPTRP
ncbi:MAG: sigma-70 family RNA polymerase sigma factor [Myxococcales bacterium]|nr:sigma-70 family RNA polymerase sigma factor [Myxococcales bacterium]